MDGNDQSPSPLIFEDDLLALGADVNAEVIDGEVVIRPAGKLDHGIYGNRFNTFFAAYLATPPLGRGFSDQTIYITCEGRRGSIKDALVPDVSGAFLITMRELRYLGCIAFIWGSGLLLLTGLLVLARHQSPRLQALLYWQHLPGPNAPGPVVESRLYRLALDGGLPRYVTTCPDSCVSVEGLNDERWLYYTRFIVTGGEVNRNDLWRMAYDGRQRQPLSAETFVLEIHGWSPDGEWLIYSGIAADSETWRDYKARADGSSFGPLAPGEWSGPLPGTTEAATRPAAVLPPGYELVSRSPDGAYLVVRSYPPHNGSELQLADGQGTRLFSLPPAATGFAAWLPVVDLAWHAGALAGLGLALVGLALGRMPTTRVAMARR